MKRLIVLLVVVTLAFGVSVAQAGIVRAIDIIDVWIEADCLALEVAYSYPAGGKATHLFTLPVVVAISYPAEKGSCLVRVSSGKEGVRVYSAKTEIARKIHDLVPIDYE